ncbi:bifunctional lysylphosphatidylglycerol flippase/synthetase MprF [Corynebacterium sp. 13CS0277]|uniref:bifunctional lysylphosphatidylglycerol flippase/synthetase MprF n=1 Tax=Corynebacterium sp. 13CS0277 TaxID=2071994 RepID=UPI0011B25670|nr:DUF2156 domain-containing protein [Corynebacterium sp. 13CS0277]
MIITGIVLLMLLGTFFLPVEVLQLPIVAGQLRPWQLLTAGVGDLHLVGLVMSVVLALVVLPPAQRLCGPRRLVAVMLGGQVASAACGLLLVRAASAVVPAWGEQFSAQMYFTPWPWLVFTACVAAASAPALWRTRVWVAAGALAATMLLFSGTVEDFPLACGAGLGILLGHRQAGLRLAWPRVSVRERRLAVALVTVQALVGPFLAALTPPTVHRAPAGSVTEFARQIAPWRDSMLLTGWDVATRQDTPAGYDSVAWFANLMSGALPLVVVFVAALGLARGRRLAWWVMLGSQLASLLVIAASAEALAGDPATASTAEWVDLGGALAPSGLAVVLLLVTVRSFPVRGSRLNLVGLSASLLAIVGAWAAGSWVLRRHFDTPWTPGDWPRLVLPHTIAAPRTHIPQDYWAWAVTGGAHTACWVVVAVFLAGALLRVPHEDAQVARARRILASGTGDHLSAMTVWPDNRYWFATSADIPPLGGLAERGEEDPVDAGYVAYRVHLGVAITLGEPVLAGRIAGVGVDPTSAAAAAERRVLRAEIATAFEAYARSMGWQVAWYSVDEDFHRPGYRSVPVAQESLIDTRGSVTFTGKKFQDVRTARNRAAKEHITAQWTTWEEAPRRTREGIIALSEEWVQDKALPEMGFTLGGVEQLPGARLLLAVGADGHIHGVTSWLPARVDGTTRGLVLDFMRRDAAGFRPVVEFLIAEAVLAASEEGLDWVSLSGAPLAHPTPEDGDSTRVLERILDHIGHTMEPLYGFRSLASFKKKFQPQHRTWSLLYRDELALPAIGLGITKCYLPTLDIRDVAHVLAHLRTSRADATHT